jgi:hypothetical protein
MKRFLFLAVVVFQAGWLLGVLNAPRARAASFTALGSCVVTVPIVATTVQALLLATPGCDSTIGECFKIANPAAALVCTDGSALVGSTLTAGSRCWGVCTAAGCAEAVTSVPVKTNGSFVRAPIAVPGVQFLLGNGC